MEMAKKKEDIIADYLIGDSEFKHKIKLDESNHFVTDNKYCIKENFERIFNTKISCSAYDQVVNGEGSEKDKITAVYSSSLQSLLFFSQVRENHPVTIKGVEYNQAYFEYKNKVIGYPSSIDVVLVDKDEKNMLFIESKLAEIARDSKKKKDDSDNDNVGTKEVGISYLSDDSSGYYNALELKADKENNDLEQIGIKAVYVDNYPLTQEFIKGKSDEKSRIVPIKNNKYVYSYGIKQLLAHLIGIINFKKNITDKNCSTYLSHLLKNDINISFAEVYNDLNGIGNDQILEAQDNYKEHVNSVFNVLKNKTQKKNINCFITTYQEIYKKTNENYKLSKEIIKFYHL